ncbi:MAG: VWA domain-containing protein [Pseudomonadota bacterium]
MNDASASASASAFGFALAGLTPAVATALGVVGVLALTALYLLRRRRTRVVVPYVHLWAPAGANSKSERLARRLRRLLSLALQLGIFGLVLLAAADPRPVAGERGGRSVVLLIDRSASMGALDEPGSRLKRAQEIARGIVRGLHAGDRALVASFAGTVTSGTGMEEDRARLLAAIDAVAPSEEPGNLADALAFSARVLAGRARPTLVLVSDGGGGGGAGRPDAGADTPATVAALRSIDLRLAPVGRRRDNLAIVAFSARRLPTDPSSASVTVVARSFRAAASDVTLTIVAGPARVPVARRRLRLEPGARAIETLPAIALPDPRLEAILEDARDDLPLDDRAFAVIPESARLDVLVVGPPNLYLDAALLSLGAALRVERARAADAAAAAAAASDDSRARWSRYDAVIFDGVTPDPAPESGHFLYLDPHGAASPWATRGTVADPVVTDVVRDHPLVKHLGGLTDLNVSVARWLVPAAGDIAAVSAFHVPLILARARPPRLRAVAIAFDPRRSDLPLRSAFPLLLANALPWLADRPNVAALSWPTGRTITVDVTAAAGRRDDDGDGDVTVVAPGGTRTRVPVIAGGVTVPLYRAGFYDVVASDGRSVARLAANLASETESDVGPRGDLRVAGKAARAPDAPAPTGRREIWLLAVVAALLLGAGEWFTQRRRLTV